METKMSTSALNMGKPLLSPNPVSEEYKDRFVTLSRTTRQLTIRHPGIPFLGSTHVVPLHQILFLKSAADLDLLPAEYRVWGPGHSWIWWAWDLRRAGLLKKTERERCMVAKVQIGWMTFWIGFTVEDKEGFFNVLDTLELVQRGVA
jgi:hypothetical protein